MLDGVQARISTSCNGAPTEFAGAIFLLNHLDIRHGIILPTRRSAERLQTEYVRPAKMENGMLVHLRGRSCRRIRLLLTLQAAVPTFVILMTTVSCSTSPGDMPQPIAGIFDLSMFGVANQQSVQRDEGQPKVRREQPSAVASPKVATLQARQASKKTNPPPDAEEESLYQEFLEWQKRRKDQP